MGRDGYDDRQLVAAMEAQADEILRVASGSQSSEAEVLAMAAVGRAGLALAHMVRHWRRMRLTEMADVMKAPKPPADTSWLTSFRPPAEVQALLDEREWTRGGALKRLAEELFGSEVPDAAPGE
jgi:hypothetical protein